MSDIINSGVAGWLQVKPAIESGVYQLEFDNRHIGNPFIRSLHGGVTGAMIELAAQAEVEKQMEDQARLYVISSSVDYLRATRDRNLFARSTIQRISRRIAVVGVECWQGDTAMPVAQGIVTLRISAPA